MLTWPQRVNGRTAGIVCPTRKENVILMVSKETQEKARAIHGRALDKAADAYDVATLGRNAAYRLACREADAVYEEAKANWAG